MIKILFTTLIIACTLLANSQNLSLLNKIKNVVQKEEYIALAINKYIIDTGTIPQLDDNGTFILDWNKILVDDYLGTNFNKTNSFTNNEMSVYFNNGYAYIKGVFENQDEYNAKYLYLYNYYLDQRNRVNTLSPKDNTKEELVKGSLVKLDQLQKEIVELLQDTTAPSIDKTSTCNAGDKFYEILNSQLVLKYCVSTGNSFDVYANGENLVLDDISYLDIIEAPIGTKAYVKESGSWVEYYYQGSTTSKKWSKRTITTGGETGLTGDGTSTSGDNPIATVPGEKILVLRKDVGCMLVGGYIEKDISGNDVEITAGDISCWGDNNYIKFGVDPTKNVNSEYILTPVMLKTQLGNIDYNGDSLAEWNNSVHRIKYKSVAVNNNDVCAISTDNKLYCAGKINSQTILTKVRDDVKSVAMTDTTIAIVTTSGELKTRGVNLNGVLGKNSTDSSEIYSEFTTIDTEFKEVFSLTSVRTFGAIDKNDNFYIWGQRSTVDVLKPEMLGFSTTKVDEIFVNSTEFIIKDKNSKIWVTSNSKDLIETTYLDIHSITTVDKSGLKFAYSNSNKLLTSETGNLSCINYDGTSCSSLEDTIFNDAKTILETKTTTVNISKENIPAEPEVYPNEDFVDDTNWTFDLDFNVIDSSNANSNVNCDIQGYTSQTDTDKYYRCGIKGEDLTEFIIESKPIEFGLEFKNRTVEISFEMYEIDNWKNDIFFVNANGIEIINVLLSNDFLQENDSSIVEDKYVGVPLEYNLYDTAIACTSFNGGGNCNGLEKINNDEKHQFKETAKLDENGKLVLQFGAKFDVEKYENKNTEENNATLGLDKITFKLVPEEIIDEDGEKMQLKYVNKDFTCAILQDNGNSKLYCWGVIDKSIPLLNTTLSDYLINDVKIETLNNYFYISQDSILTQELDDGTFTMDNEVFLKYPTYIGGFDYDFKFR